MIRFLLILLPLPLFAAAPCRIEVVDKENGWPVPLIELRTTHQARYVTDNAGLIALDDPELMDRTVWFDVKGHGYGVPKDGFGYEGWRTSPKPGVTLRLEVERRNIAKRLGRWTGAGLFAESAKLDEKVPAEAPGIHGCDSVLMARYGERLFWLWGDTMVPGYPLGVFDSTAATTPLKPLARFEPPLVPVFEHFRDPQGAVRGVADLPGEGPTWLGGMIAVKDQGNAGEERLVATYSKISGHLDEAEVGLCVWNPQTSSFAVEKSLWKKTSGQPKPELLPRGHPVVWQDGGRDWLLFGDPFPALRCPADFAAWQDPASWRKVDPPPNPRSAADGAEVKPHRGSIVWNAFRRRWLVIFTQQYGKPSAFGEIWYAEAASPLGPWGPAVKVLSHDNYTFYNPKIHAGLPPADAPFIVFEGTYTTEFADHAPPTPRYNYNQILYRLDLDDPKLEPARQ